MYAINPKRPRPKPPARERDSDMVSPFDRSQLPADRLSRVVRRLDGHLDVVRVRLLEPGRGDTHELAELLELGDRASADVEHRLPKPSDELIHRGPERTAVWHPAL